MDIAFVPNKSRGMAFTPRPLPGDAEPRHSDEWYGDALSGSQLQAGDRLFIPCQGGPCISRLEIFPPRLELEEEGGLYVLVDDGLPESWVYQFVAVIDR
jgi:hypothetical protein